MFVEGSQLTDAPQSSYRWELRYRKGTSKYVMTLTMADPWDLFFMNYDLFGTLYRENY
jgi:hypothetical protein